MTYLVGVLATWVLATVFVYIAFLRDNNLFDTEIGRWMAALGLGLSAALFWPLAYVGLLVWFLSWRLVRFLDLKKAEYRAAGVVSRGDAE